MQHIHVPSFDAEHFCFLFLFCIHVSLCAVYMYNVAGIRASLKTKEPLADYFH